MTSMDPGTPALETSALPNSHASIPDTTAAHSPDRPLPGHETAHTFLRDANFTLERSQSKSASRITAVIRRLGSVPSPQVKANADTIRNTVIALIGLAASEPRVDAAMFLMAYSKSVLRHQKLLSALRSDGRYNRAIDALIFDPLHRTATSLPTTGAYSFDGNGAAEIGVGRENSDTRAKADTAGAADADDLSSVLDKPQQQAQQQPPRIFQNPSTFSQALAALVRLHLCPPAFWEAIVVWGVPCMNGREASTLPALSSGGPTQHSDAGSFAAAASEEPHAAGAPQRPDWERKNAAIAVTVTEMLGLRFANPRPAEGLDARPAVRQAWRLPALPPPDAVREVEAYAAGVVQQLSGEEVARVIYNFGQAQLRPQSDVLCVLEERALSHAAAMSVRSISLLLGGYVGMRVRPGPLLEDVMTRRLDQVADGMSIHPLSVVLLQTAKLGATLPEATFAACVARMHSLFEGAAFDTKKFAPRLLWACAVYTTVHGPGVARQAQLEAASWALVRAFAELWEAGRLGCERDGTTILRQVLLPLRVPPADPRFPSLGRVGWSRRPHDRVLLHVLRAVLPLSSGTALMCVSWVPHLVAPVAHRGKCPLAMRLCVLWGAGRQRMMHGCTVCVLHLDACVSCGSVCAVLCLWLSQVADGSVHAVRLLALGEALPGCQTCFGARNPPDRHWRRL